MKKMPTANFYCLLPGNDFDRIIDMDNIQECALHFLNSVNTTSYVFHLVNRDVRVVSLLIKCNYIIESQLKELHTTVYIFLKYRSGLGTPCGIVSFGVKKNVSYGGRKLYWMLKDKIINGNRITIYQNPKYTSEQKQKNET